jgi:hypothetical protein
VTCDSGADFGGSKEKRTIVAGSLDNLDALLDNDITILGVGRRSHGWEQRQVNAKGLVCHGTAPADLAAEMLGSGLRQGGQDSKTSSVGDGRGELGSADLQERFPYKKEHAKVSQ